MMELVKQWLLGITGAAVLVALAEGIMPEGGIRQVGKLTCGLLLLSAVLRPLAGENLSVFPEDWFCDGAQLQSLRGETQIRMEQIIEEEFSAYSMDKARELGVSCEIRVSCQQEESGIFLPEQAEISGITGDEAQNIVAVMLCTELGLPQEALIFEEGGRR